MQRPDASAVVMKICAFSWLLKIQVRPSLMLIAPGFLTLDSSSSCSVDTASCRKHLVLKGRRIMSADHPHPGVCVTCGLCEKQQDWGALCSGREVGKVNFSWLMSHLCWRSHLLCNHPGQYCLCPFPDLLSENQLRHFPLSWLPCTPLKYLGPYHPLLSRNFTMF